MVSSWRAMRVRWERVDLMTRLGRLAEPRPRPTYGVCRSTFFSQATLSHPSTAPATFQWSPSVRIDASHIPAVHPQLRPRCCQWRGICLSNTSGKPIVIL